MEKERDDGMTEEIQRPAAELLYAEELQRLIAAEGDAPRPAGWKLTPLSVLRFILGDDAGELTPKFVGSRSMLERCIVALATNRGLMLIGESGTAKSYLSELLAALKRRFNFETVPPIANLGEEMALVQRETDRLLSRAAIPISLTPELTELLVTTFHELRTGKTADGQALEPLGTVMSTAEA